MRLNQLLNNTRLIVWLIVWLISFVTCLMGCSEPMEKFDYDKEYQACLPEPLSIDEMGWDAFLKQWNNEVVFWVKKTLLQFGFYSYSLDRSQEYWKKHLKKVNLSEHYLVLRQGGLDFPPENDSDQKSVDNILKLHREYEQELYNRNKDRVIEGIEDQSPFVDSESAIIYYDSLMFEPASEEAIKAKEKEFGISLPETYKDFLKASNGWILDDLMLAPVEDISWTFSAEQASYLFWNEMLWDERYPNLKPGDPLPEDIRKMFEEYGDYNQYEFERTGLLISKSFDREYLVFNPHKLTPDGDWLGWSDSADGDYQSAYGEPPLKPFKTLMEEYYRRDVARRCVTYKELEHIRG